MTKPSVNVNRWFYAYLKAMKLAILRYLLLFLPFLCLAAIANAQISRPDSLRKVLQHATSDSARHNACIDLYFYYFELNRDSGLYYTEKRLDLARKNNIKLAEASALISIGYQYNNMGRYSEAYRNLTEALRIAEDPKNDEVVGWKVAQYPLPDQNRLLILSTAHHVLGGLMLDVGNIEQEIVQLKKALEIAVQINHPDRQMVANMNLGTTYLRMGKPDSALYFSNASRSISENNLAQQYRGNNTLTIGNIYWTKGDKLQARKYYFEALHSALDQNNQSDLAKINHRLALLYLQEENKDSALHYAVANLKVLQSLGGFATQNATIGTAYEDLYLVYKSRNQVDSAYKYQGLALAVKDSLHNIRIRNLADFQKLSLGEALRLENLEKEKIQTQTNIRTYGMLSGLAVLSIIGFILYRNNRQKQTANGILQTTLSHLTTTQAQLIQSEKMASLGELTAGIAHEIQNPLNFVNNFSEVNKELITELEEAANTGDLDEVKAIASDLKANEEKISHHGKRADSIVKGMLQHSQKGSGQKEQTDINEMADEYLRLAYHGLRAKDNTMNANMETVLDESIGKVMVVQQDISRVLLNLYNNAFYAVAERFKKEGGQYKPVVTLTTSKHSGQVYITVSDNGSGIPEHIRQKIFQPFFTTKPTGEGTGLGLSLSYDIIKAHGGEIKVESTEGEGSTFTIVIPG